MKTLLSSLIFVGLASNAIAGKELSSCIYGEHNDTHETFCSFYIGDYKRGFFIGPCGFGTSKARCQYQVTLLGPGERFPVEHVTIKDPASGKDAHPVAGEVLLNWKKKIVTISITIANGTKTEDFICNGTFKIKKKEIL